MTFSLTVFRNQACPESSISSHFFIGQADQPCFFTSAYGIAPLVGTQPLRSLIHICNRFRVTSPHGSREPNSHDHQRAGVKTGAASSGVKGVGGLSSQVIHSRLSGLRVERTCTS